LEMDMVERIRERLRSGELVPTMCPIINRVSINIVFPEISS